MKTWKPMPTHVLGAALISSMGFGALFWGPHSNDDKLLLGHDQWLSSVAFTPDGNSIVSGAGLHELKSETKLWDWAHGSSRELAGHTGSVEAIAFSPDGAQLATAGYDQQIRLWDVHHGYECLRTLPGHDGIIRLLAYSNDGRTLISAGNDQVVKFWDVASGQERSRLVGFDAIGLAPQNGCFAAREATTKSIVMRDLTTGEAREVFKPGDGYTMSGAFSADGKMFAAGGFNWCVNVYQLGTGRCVPLVGHDDYIIAVAFSPDGKHLATACQDKTVKIWDLETGRETRTLIGHTGPVTSVAFSADGKRLVSGGYDKTVRVWHLNEK